MMLWASLCFAELPPPDYAAELADAAAEQIAALARDGQMPAAEDFAGRWRRSVTLSAAQDAKLAYELGLGWRLAGDEARALHALNQAVKAAPDMIAARYDRGEILLNRGDLDAAKLDFGEVVKADPEAWPAHFRLADIAGREGDAVAFEAELLLALRGGFTFRAVAEDPRWRGWTRDAVLGAPLRRLITVYQGDDVMGLFE